MALSFIIILVIALDDKIENVGAINHSLENQQNTNSNATEISLIGAVFAVASALGASVAAVATRKM